MASHSVARCDVEEGFKKEEIEERENERLSRENSSKNRSRKSYTIETKLCGSSVQL